MDQKELVLRILTKMSILLEYNVVDIRNLTNELEQRMLVGIVGIGKAMEIATEELGDYGKKLKILRDYYFENVERNIPFIRINGDMENRLPGNANICFKGVDGTQMLQELDKRGICASSGSACSAGLLNPSHVLLAIGVPASIARSSLRVTFGRENSIEDVDYLVQNLAEVVQQLR